MAIRKSPPPQAMIPEENCLNKKGAHVRLDMSTLAISCLERLYVLCLKPFRALRDIELYSLAFLQAAESARLNRRKMHENIFATLTADESKALRVVKPLHCSCFHWCFFS